LGHITIRQAAYYHPEHVVSNDYYLEHFQSMGKDIKRFLEVMGRDRRYIVNDKDENALTMGLKAAQNALQEANLQGEDMDFGWGKPFDATGGEGVLPPGYVCLLQQKTTGDVTVVITVEKEGGHAMKTDTLLNKYATLVRIR